MSFWFLYDNSEKLELEKDNLDKEINFLLDSDKFYWDKIYLFSAFVSEYGVKKVKEIISHESLNENTEVLIAIGTKNYFNKPSDIQEVLSLSKSQKIKTNLVSFICPKTINDESHINDNFHIKSYCFLGSSMKRRGSKIGFSIIGSSNLTKAGLEGKGELCISIQNLNLTKELIYRLSKKYSKSPPWDQEIIKEYERQYNKEHSRKDQNEVLPPSKENSTPVNEDQQPIPKRPDGKFLKLGVIKDIALIDKATNLVNGREKIDWFHWSHTTIEQAKEDLPKRSLCLLFSTENKIFQIGEIMSHSSDQEKPEGCFVRYIVNVTYELSDDIGEILAKEKYKIISDPEPMEELPYDTLKDFEEEVNKYQKMLNDPNYQTGLKKGEKKMQKMQSEIDSILELENDPSLMKEQIKKILQSI